MGRVSYVGMFICADNPTLKRALDSEITRFYSGWQVCFPGFRSCSSDALIGCSQLAYRGLYAPGLRDNLVVFVKKLSSCPSLSRSCAASSARSTPCSLKLMKCDIPQDSTEVLWDVASCLWSNF